MALEMLTLSIDDVLKKILNDDETGKRSDAAENEDSVPVRILPINEALRPKRASEVTQRFMSDDAETERFSSLSSQLRPNQPASYAWKASGLDNWALTHFQSRPSNPALTSPMKAFGQVTEPAWMANLATPPVLPPALTSPMKAFGQVTEPAWMKAHHARAISRPPTHLISTVDVLSRIVAPPRVSPIFGTPLDGKHAGVRGRSARSKNSSGTQPKATLQELAHSSSDLADLVEAERTAQKAIERLGGKAAAYLAESRSVSDVEAIARGDRTVSKEVIQRLKIANRAIEIITAFDGVPAARAWIQGKNRHLDDVSPSRYLRDVGSEGAAADVLGAARAFIAGG